MQRSDTPHPKIVHLVTGHYRENSGYATWRVCGTTDWLLIYTLDGQGRFGYDGGQVMAQQGDMFLLRPGTRHDYGTAAGKPFWELLWTHFHPRAHWFEWLRWPEVAPGLMRLALRAGEPRERIVDRFYEVHRRATGAAARREDFAMNALEEALLLCDTLNPEMAEARIDDRVRAAMDYLCRNLAETIAMPALARCCGLSESRLGHLFRQQVGLTPQQFLERQRMNRAQQLLELTSRTIQEIGAEVGFDNPFYFSQRFKRCTGLSPRNYRKKEHIGCLDMISL